MGEHAAPRTYGVRSVWSKLMRCLRWRTAKELSERWGGWRRS
ncbi:hypothetical protein SEA_FRANKENWEENIE_38 [Streptomyces phage Frankenweenie]|nr:hypothetical protein SEA_FRANKENWEENIE_38 [Streptomyces phage Frankenweenie]